MRSIDATGIETARHFCILPWLHARLGQEGGVSPCCRIDESFSFGNLKTQTLAEVLNGEAACKMREALLQDAAVPACRDCYKVEASGGLSMRREFNAIYKHEAESRTAKTSDDGFIEKIEVKYLDIRFSNLCNLRCRSCGPWNSTSWYGDAKAVSGSKLSETIFPTNTFDEFWTKLSPHIDSLERLYIAGGEPLIEDRHYQFLEKLIEIGRTDIELHYNTNMSRLSHRAWSAPALWTQFRSVNIAASLDGVGAQAEYIRKGLRWSDVEKNFMTLRRESPHVGWTLFPTVSVLNAFHITEAIDQLLSTQMLERADQITFNILNEPRYLNVSVFNETERSRLRQHYVVYLNGLSSRVSEAMFERLSGEFKRLLRAMDLEHFEDQRKMFRQVTMRLDQQRGEKAVELFPELFELLYLTS